MGSENAGPNKPFMNSVYRPQMVTVQWAMTFTLVFPCFLQLMLHEIFANYPGHEKIDIAIFGNVC